MERDPRVGPEARTDPLKAGDSGELDTGMTMNLGNSLSMSAEKLPHKVAIVVDEQRRTYAELNTRVNQLANGLLDNDLKKGDRIGILSPNSVAWVEALYAIFKMGAVAVPMNHRLLHRELVYELKRNDVAGLFLTADYLDAARSYRTAKGKEPSLIVLEGAAPEDALSLESIAAGSPDREPAVKVERDDMAVIMFTGGTTGSPKGAICTHETLVWTTINYMVEYETPRVDHIMLHPFPLFHTSGLYRLVSYIWAGATYLTMRNYGTEKCLRLIEEYRATAFIGSSAVFVPMLELKERKAVDSSSVTICCATFAFMDQKGRTGLRALFPNAGIYEGYGLTEGGAISVLRPGQVAREAGCVGRPGVNTRLKVVDDQGKEARAGKVGEVVIRGPSVPRGYFGNREETDAAFRDGWFHTGDMGKLDEDGFLYIVDRKKDMIKTGGENVYSREVEEALLRHPDIIEAAVIGVPHERWGETIMAIVVTGRGAELSEQDVIGFCKQHVASYKKPTVVEFVASIPKTETGGKVSKWKLREKYVNR